MALNGGTNLSLWDGVLGRAAGLGCGRAGCGSLLGLLGLFGGGGKAARFSCVPVGCGLACGGDCSGAGIWAGLILF